MFYESVRTVERMDTLDERILPLWLAATLVVATAIGLAVGVADALFVGVGAWLGPAAFVATMFLGSLYVVARYRTFRFEFDRDTIYIERGVFTRVRTGIPVTYVRRVDVRRGLFGRLVGLQRLVVYTVGSGRATVAVPGLSSDRATALQDRLQTGPMRRQAAIEPDGTIPQYDSSTTSDPASS